MIALLDQLDGIASWEAILNRWGLPLVLIAVASVALFRFARWLDPLITDVVRAHIKFMSSIDDRTSELVKKTDQTNELLKEIRTEVRK